MRPAKRTSFPYSSSRLELPKCLPRLQPNNHELKSTTSSVPIRWKGVERGKLMC